MSKGTLKGLSDTVTGKAKRALGELTGRPDIVLDGEKQETLGHKETLEAERHARSEEEGNEDPPVKFSAAKPRSTREPTKE